MNRTRASKTAMQMAVSRAIEARTPERDRICNDTLAWSMLDRRERLLLSTGIARRAIVRLIERLFAGHHHYVLARTRFIDRFLLHNLDGIEQLVVLGAGFDSRAYRFARELQMVPVFEVDHPATSQLKRDRLRR